jgi:hypothetical protein
MKIEFTKHRHLNALARTVNPGDVLESSSNIPETLLQAYVSNGIATVVTAADNPVPKVIQNIDGGD